MRNRLYKMLLFFLALTLSLGWMACVSGGEDPLSVAYQPLPIKSLLNMNNWEAEADLYPAYRHMLLLQIDAREMLLPVTYDGEYMVVADTVPANKLYGGEVRLSSFLSTYPWMDESTAFFTIIRELVSDQVVGEIDDYGQFYPREDYFRGLLADGSHMQAIRSNVFVNGVEAPPSWQFTSYEGVPHTVLRGDARTFTIDALARMLAYRHNGMQIDEKALEQWMTLDSFRDWYLRNIPQAYWPVVPVE